MIGYDTYGEQYPTSWDEKEVDLIHSELSIFEGCDGAIEEYREKPDGWPEKTFYRCEKCGKDVTADVLDMDYESWRHGYEA